MAGSSKVDDQAKINEIVAKLDIEQKCLEGAQNLYSQLRDPVLLGQVQQTIRDSQRRMGYLESELKKLVDQSGAQTDVAWQGGPRRASEAGPVLTSMQSPSARSKSQGGPVPMPGQLGQPDGVTSPYATPPHQTESPKHDASFHTGTVGRPHALKDERQQTSGMFDRVLNRLGVKGAAGPGYGPGMAVGPTIPVARSREEFVAAVPFDYWRCDSALTTEKLVHKLQEIRFKVDVEQKVKAGTERLFQVVSASAGTDRERRQQVEDKLAESNGKMALLLKAQQRYQGLFVGDLESLNDDDPHGSGKPLRRPVTGRLSIFMIGASGLPNKKSHRSDAYAVIKVDGVPRGKTKNAPVKWLENIDIPLDRAQEVEIGIFEKGGGLLSIAWFKLTELDESLRLIRSNARPNGPAQDSGAEGDPGKEGVDYWLDMEPGGQINVKFHLEVEETRLRRRNEGVARRKPVQKVFPTKGHKFAAMQFYQVMKCAVCSDLLISGQGYQCQACKYTCHKKCQSRVITKCITITDKERDEGEGQDQLLKHRIPHRFEPSTSLGANWCCHCGYMLPFGKRQSLRCTECGTTAHKECTHLVPNLCGLTPALIDQMKSAIDQAEKIRKEKAIMKAEQARLKEERERQTLQRPPVEEVAISQENLVQPIEDDHHEPAARDQRPSVAAQPEATAGKESQLATTDFSPTVQRRITSSGGAVISKPVSSSTPASGKKRSPRGIGLDDFNFVAVLGKGNFGKVMLAEEKATKQLYAIKVLKKEFILENDEVESTRSEKRVFLAANKERHPFLVNLHSCFQTESRIYFVMEYVSGGDLMWHIQRQQFSEKRAKYYACEVLLALEYFHKQNIVYRDLKLDNILLSLEGHIKIADYGLCKENMPHGSTTSTFCGTPEFMAPEILLEKPYTRAVDWWALGVLIYEMLLGQSPFRGDDEDEIFEAILHDEVVFPSGMPKEAVNILQKLLTKDPSRRLGSGKSDAEEIRRHPFFAGVDFDAMLALKVTPPFFPTITCATDISNFDTEFTKEVPVLTPCNTVLSTADQEEFRGFTYLRYWAQQTRSKLPPSAAGGTIGRPSASERRT
ncbi:kinase-like domain-containing protein [Zopfochytrium polystomum]|nr:kinase-like domain-containing protein [Zopfochytrium polystomum]